jgi:hypothetical protein
MPQAPAPREGVRQGDSDPMTTLFSGLGADPHLSWNTRLAASVCERKSRRNPHARVGASFASIHLHRPIRLSVTNATPGGGRAHGQLGFSAGPRSDRCAGLGVRVGIPTRLWLATGPHPSMGRQNSASGPAPHGLKAATARAASDPYDLINAGSSILTARPHITISDRVGSQASCLFHGRTP